MDICTFGLQNELFLGRVGQQKSGPLQPVGAVGAVGAPVEENF